MKYKNTEIPGWLEDQLKQMSPEPDFNDLLELMLQDYIKRNKPPWWNLTPDEYVYKYAVKRTGNKIAFYNHDFDRWEEPTPETQEAWEKLNKYFLAQDPLLKEDK